MMSITEAAVAQLDRVRASAKVPEETCFRIAEEEGDFNLLWDRARPGDTTLSHNGRTILVLDSEVAPRLDDKMLDAQPTDHGVQFVFVQVV
jgi:hypothetical protein